MTNKYKVSEMAKDFGIASKDLIALILETTGTEKKSSTSLNETEIGIVFDAITKKHSVKSFKEYFATGDKAREEEKKERQNKKDQMLASQLAILEQLKAAAAADSAKKEEAKKAKTTATKTKEPAKTGDKVAEKPKKTADKKAEETPKTPKKTATQQRVESAKPTPKKETTPYDGPLVAPPKKEKKESIAPNRGPAQLRHVDTRQSNINIDK